MNEKSYCSELAFSAAAPQFGTAVQVDVWLLVEYNRAWRPKALLDNELDEPVRDHLNLLPADLSKLHGLRLRVQFIKSKTRDAKKIFVAHAHAQLQQIFAGELDSYEALLAIDAAEIMQPQNLTKSDEPLYLVCTNGQRDLCCAKFGMPLYEVLSQHAPQQVWQTTHIGGHRYAPNLVSLPSGLVYGFVQPEIAQSLVDAHNSGHMDISRLRGRSFLSPLAQAAEYYLRTHLELSDINALKFLTESSTEHGATVSFDHAGQKYQVALTQSVGEPVIASCEGKPKPVVEYTLNQIN